MTPIRTLRVAWKGLTGNKLRTFLMMLGIIVGIAALTVIMAMGEGTKVDLARRANQMWAQTHVTVFANKPGAGFTPGKMPAVDEVPPTLTDEDAKAIAEQVPNVATAAPTQSKPGVSVKYRERSSLDTVFGIVPEWQALRSYSIVEGEPITQEDLDTLARVCVIAPTVVKELFGDGDALGATIRIENSAFRVKGIVAAKGITPMGADFDDRILIPLSTFSRRLYNVTNLTQITIALKDPSRMGASAADIEAVLRERHGTARPEDEDFSVRLADDIVKAAGSSSRTLTIFLAIVGAISLLVGGVVVMNIMLISVSERTREIGIRRAVGASRRDILAQFRMEALVVTITAGLCGVALGAVVSAVLPMLTKMQTAYSWQATALAAAFSVGIGLVFGIQPARHAADLNPVQALRSQ
jgi:putative ABC transport system permease protein